MAGSVGMAEGEKMNRKVICVYAERAKGPGWANAPLWIVLRDEKGDLSEHCVQPHERTAGGHALYDTAAALPEALCLEANEWCHKRGLIA